MAVVRAASGCGGAGRSFWIPACAAMTSEGGLRRRRSAGCCAVRVRAVAEKYSQARDPGRIRPPAHAQSRHAGEGRYPVRPLELPKARGTSTAVVRAASRCGRAGRGFWIPACAAMTSGGGLRRRSAGCCAVQVRAAAEIQPSPRPRPHPPTQPHAQSRHAGEGRYPVRPLELPKARGNQHGRGAGGQRVWRCRAWFLDSGLRRNDEARVACGGVLRAAAQCGSAPLLKSSQARDPGHRARPPAPRPIPSCRRRPVSSAAYGVAEGALEPARPWCGRPAGVAVPGVVSGFRPAPE